MTKLNRYIILSIFFIVTCCVSCQPLMDRIYWSSYPGAMRDGRCEEYARAADAKLRREGIESYYVEFDWERGKVKGRHSAVVFQKAGEWFIVDNETSLPKRVKRATLIEMLHEWIPEYKILGITNSATIKDL